MERVAGGGLRCGGCFREDAVAGLGLEQDGKVVRGETGRERGPGRGGEGFNGVRGGEGAGLSGGTRGGRENPLADK